MASNDLIHTTEIMRAAIPYVDYRTQTTLDLFTKFFDFMSCFQNFNNRTDLSACGFENDHIDVEALFAGIRPACNSKEREFVDNILNIFNAKRVFETYNTYMSAMKAMQESDGNPDNSSAYSESEEYSNFTSAASNSNVGSNSNTNTSENSSQKSNGGFNPNMLNMLKAFVPPEQASTFENISMLLNTMSYDNNKADKS